MEWSCTSSWLLSNHYHLLLAPTDAKQLAEFMTFVNSNIAREVGRLVDWKEKFWGRRYQGDPSQRRDPGSTGPAPILLGEQRQGAPGRESPRMAGSPLCAGAYRRPEARGYMVRPHGFYRAQQRRKAGQPPVPENNFKTTEVLELSPLPCLADLSETDRRRYVESLIEKVVAEAASVRKVNGSMVLGARRLQKQHPHTQPNRMKQSPAPRFHTFTVAVQKALRDAYSAFAAAFRLASSRLRGGDHGVRFPEGCFPPALPFLCLEPEAYFDTYLRGPGPRGAELAHRRFQ